MTPADSKRIQGGQVAPWPWIVSYFFLIFSVCYVRITVLSDRWEINLKNQNCSPDRVRMESKAANFYSGIIIASDSCSILVRRLMPQIASAARSPQWTDHQVVGMGSVSKGWIQPSARLDSIASPKNWPQPHHPSFFPVSLSYASRWAVRAVPNDIWLWTNDE